MTKTQIYYYREDVVLSIREIIRFFKNTIINFQRSIKPIRVENKLLKNKGIIPVSFIAAATSILVNCAILLLNRLFV